MKANLNSSNPVLMAIVSALLLAAAPATAAPKIILISLDGATPRFVEQYLADGTLPPNDGLGLLRNKGFLAEINRTVSPSLTAVGHIAIATGSSAAKNDVVANSFHLVASPFNFNVSGFGAPIGGYCIDCNAGGPGMTPNPTAEPLWVRLRYVGGKKVATATWPGGDGVDVRVPGVANNAIVQSAAERTVDYTVPFGAFAALAATPGGGAHGFSLNAVDFALAPAQTVNQLIAAGKNSFSPVLQKTSLLETLVTGGATNRIALVALDTTNDGITNYDTLVFFDTDLGIQPGPFVLPSTGPAYVKASEKRGSHFFIEGSSSKAGCAYYVCRLEPDLSIVRISRTSANSIPRNAAVLSVVDDINAYVGFWAPQPDFRIVERISPGYGTFPDIELEEIYADRVRDFTDYQKRVALHAISRVPDADLVMVYFEQPDGSFHQFLLDDPRQPTDFTNPNSIGSGQDAAKVTRYQSYLRFAYKTVNDAIQEIIEMVGVNAEGEPNSNIIAVSDHGFESFHTAVNINALLSANGIPSSKVRAITSGPAMNIYINLQGREPNGTVTREEYRMLQQQVAEVLQNAKDTNAVYTLGKADVALFDQVHLRPLPADNNDPSFGRGTAEFIGQDSGDLYALLAVGYNFDGIQNPVVVRQGDAAPVSPAVPVLSVPNFYGAHGYDPTIPNLSSILLASGPDVGRGVLPLARNIDVAPTIAKMLGVELFSGVDGEPLPIEPLELTMAVSRKTHGKAGQFDLSLPLGSIGVEGRKAGDDEAEGTHLLVFTFSKPLANASAVVTSGIGNVAGVLVGSNQQIGVKLSNVADRQSVMLRLAVTDIYGETLKTIFGVTFLRGDVNRDGIVDLQDVQIVESVASKRSETVVNESNFTADVAPNGKINNSDAAQVRTRLGALAN
jgi:predicted AlkP superfamily pyrophosphatase or phosphodiesterase